MGPKAHLPLGFAPPLLPLGALGPCEGGAPAHLGLVPSHTWPMQPSGLVAPLGGPPGPPWWSRYVTNKTRNFSCDQNRTSHI